VTGDGLTCDCPDPAVTAAASRVAALYARLLAALARRKGETRDGR